MDNNTENNKDGTREEEMKFPNPYEIWKKMYFAAEDALSATVRESIKTQSFARMIDAMLDNYLTFHKLYTETTNKWAEAFPFATKYDVARVAELVVGLEEKVDNIELNFLEQMSRLANSLGKIADQSQTLLAVRSNEETLQSAIANIENSLGELKEALLRWEKTFKNRDSSLTEPGDPAESEKEKPARQRKKKQE
jgi:polyhydroxyalkanoic acid synthase PhaR subunit